jgi:uncharacterized lipoprotein YajG
MVQHMTRIWPKIALIGLALLAGIACAKKSYIYVDYRLPTITDQLQGRTVFVETHDLRSNKEIFNPRAKDAFANFTGLFSLSLVKPNDEQTLKGAYELPMLFEAALKERLHTLGITIAGEQTANIPLFKIDLNQFRIKLVGQKWIAEISYEVSLTQDNQTVSREVVTGSAERLKIIGSGGAEKVIGEIFTEMINRLNVERLFQQANL